MKGKVLDFSVAQGTGVISGDDGNRYVFQGVEWKPQSLPTAGTQVDFETEGKSASAVYLDSPTSRTDGGSSEVPRDERYQSLYCSKDEKILLGFCGGLAHKFGLPAAAMRVTVILSLFVFIGWFYFVGIFLPKLPTKNVPRPA